MLSDAHAIFGSSPTGGIWTGEPCHGQTPNLIGRAFSFVLVPDDNLALQIDAKALLDRLGVIACVALPLCIRYLLYALLLGAVHE